MTWAENLFAYASVQRVMDQLFFNARFIPLIVVLLLWECWQMGWRESSLTAFFRPRQTDRWDLFSFILFVTGGRKMLGNLLFLGSFAFVAPWMKEHQGAPLAEIFPVWLEILIAWVAADFFNYWAHRLRHVDGWLWEVHQFHHSATRVSFWTNFRVHPMDYLIYFPFEILLPNILFGWSLLDNVFYIFLAEFPGYFAHLRLDIDLKWVGRYLLVGPRYHHLHHSRTSGKNRNFGDRLVIWDRLFGTYEEPSRSLKSFETGVDQNPYEGPRPLQAYWLPIRNFYYLLPKAIVFGFDRIKRK